MESISNKLHISHTLYIFSLHHQQYFFTFFVVSSIADYSNDRIYRGRNPPYIWVKEKMCFDNHQKYFDIGGMELVMCCSTSHRQKDCFLALGEIWVICWRYMFLAKVVGSPSKCHFLARTSYNDHGEIEARPKHSSRRRRHPAFTFTLLYVSSSNYQ